MSKPNINVLIGGPKNKHSYTYKEVILKENFPLSQQMVEKNRKYVVKWNFDLNGETVTVPENSILEFDGGTLHDGTIIGQNTFINDIGGLGSEKLFAEDIIREGTWRTNGGGSFEQVQSDWHQTNANRPDFIKHKPNIPAEQVQSDWNQTNSESKDFIKNKPKLANIATSGSYNDLNDKPTIPEGVIVDSALSKTSTNPVQNKVIAEALENAGGNPDKPYDPTKHSGLGRKTLKLGKNGSNVLTQEDFDTENTIYVIKYDFDLNGADIQMPKGCVLDFEGGCVDNGKLISNNTIIVGSHRGNALYGVYLNNLKSPFSYNYKEIKTLKLSVEHGYTPWITNTTRKRVGQSIAVFKHNNKKYIATFHIEESNASGGIYLFDEYYNLIKYVTLQEGQLTHFNDATVKGTDILVADCLSTSKGIRRISISNLISAVDGGTVASDKLSICSDKTVVSIDYDNVRHELAVLDDSYTLTVYNDNNEIVSTTTGISDAISQKLERITYQGMIYKNGQLMMLLWATQLSGYTAMAAAIPVVIDLKTKEVFIHSMEAVPYGDAEIEGVCKDCDNDSIYWSLYHMWTDGEGSTSRNAIVKHSFDEGFEGVSDYINTGYGALGEGTYINVYVSERGILVNNNYTKDYIATGSPGYPFKTLDSAILCRGFLAGRVRYLLLGGDYYLGRYTIANRFMHFIGFSSSSSTIHGKISVWNGYVGLDNITIINDWDNSTVVNGGENSYLYISNVNFIKPNGSTVSEAAIMLANSDMQITGTSFDKFNYCISLESSIVRRCLNLTVKNCNFVFSIAAQSKVMADSLNTAITFKNNSTKLITCSAVADNAISLRLEPSSCAQFFEFVKNRIIAAGEYYNAGVINLQISANFTAFYNTSTRAYRYRNNEDQPRENEVEVNISRGRYYYNGYNFISIDGRKTIFSVNNPNYQQLPLSDVVPGDLYFDNDNNIPALYKGANSWLKLLTSRALSFTGSLDDCHEQGFFYFAPTGDKPDLGGVTQNEWYYVINIGRDDICQIITQNLGTKIAMRNYVSSSSNSYWSDWIIFESAPQSNNVEN